MAYATTVNVEAMWRPLTDDEVLVVSTLLDYASRIIDSEFSDISARIAAGTLDADLVADINTSMVIRRMQNPEGLRRYSKQIDDYSTMRDYDIARHEMDLLPGEYRRLSPSRARAFSVRLSR